ncbi:hypothetical protein [Mycobacterium botniense]|uniref:hypothetical protein n=1 Tax=Mycobacterium botniense TaxID=84962 RepID=UPI0013D1D1A3|nr:hypothetical protein [Mycobacterium botniense]
MTSASEECAAEQRRLADASSVVNVVARHVDGLVQLRPEQLPGWPKDLGVPPG